MIRSTVIALLFLASDLLGQSKLLIDKLTYNDGLTTNSVVEIIRDSMRLRWFATQNGLNRYDGYELEIIQHKASHSTSLGSNDLRTVMEDDFGNI